LAVIASFLLERVAIGIVDHRLFSAIDFVHFPLTPLAPTTFTLCLAIAILCDVDLQLGNGWLRRISEGALCGTTMVMTIAACLQLLDIASATAGQTAPWLPFAFSFSIGFLCGFVSPHLYRSARGELPVNRASILNQNAAAVSPDFE
jgi:hypothetical protein